MTWTKSNNAAHGILMTLATLIVTALAIAGPPLAAGADAGDGEAERGGRRGEARSAAREDQATSGTQTPRPGRDLWAARLNRPDAFDNHGVETFYHKTIVSKNINFNGQPETEIGYTLYLPPDYETSGERYPVLYFLHGLGGNEHTVSVVVQSADELIRKGALPPFIIAAINGGQSFYGNHFEGKFQVHDFFIEEFIPHIDSTCRTKADRANRHLMGFSMGGYGATMFGVKHPDLFRAFTDIAGALQGPRFNVWPEMYNESDENFRPYDIFVLLEENKEALKDVGIAIWIGSEDICRPISEQFHRTLTEMGLEHEFNDWNAHPPLEGVPHNLPRYFELYGEEILKFHTDRFGDQTAEPSRDQ